MVTQVHSGEVYTIVDASPGPENRCRDDAQGLHMDAPGRTRTQAAVVGVDVDR